MSVRWWVDRKGSKYRDCSKTMGGYIWCSEGTGRDGFCGVYYDFYIIECRGFMKHVSHINNFAYIPTIQWLIKIASSFEHSIHIYNMIQKDGCVCLALHSLSWIVWVIRPNASIREECSTCSTKIFLIYICTYINLQIVLAPAIKWWYK
jgi:hypothetical protein